MMEDCPETPPPSAERDVDLPWCAPKPATEDRRAPDLVRRIMASPSYRAGDHDVDFLDRDDMRGVRLMLDYQKAETLLQAHGIAHSVVVFGATRIPEPARAAAEVAARAAAFPAIRPCKTPSPSPGAWPTRVATTTSRAPSGGSSARRKGRPATGWWWSPAAGRA